MPPGAIIWDASVVNVETMYMVTVVTIVVLVMWTVMSKCSQAGTCYCNGSSPCIGVCQAELPVFAHCAKHDNGCHIYCD